MYEQHKLDTEIVKALSRRGDGRSMERELNITALIIDDEAMARELMRLMLASAGFTVIEATSGSEAVALLRSEILLPDVILVDVMMPGQNGYDVCRSLRRLPASADVPIIMLSGKANNDSESLALQAGANRFLTKPVEHPTLIGNIYDLVAEGI